jgi:hypothetical protein
LVHLVEHDSSIAAAAAAAAVVGGGGGKGEEGRGTWVQKLFNLEMVESWTLDVCLFLYLYLFIYIFSAVERNLSRDVRLDTLSWGAEKLMRQGCGIGSIWYEMS